MSSRSGREERAPEWRFGRSWSEEELADRLRALEGRAVTGPESERDAQSWEWRHYYSRASIALESPGPPGPAAVFERARELVGRYAFSDPRIVIGHFDATVPLLGRRMLLEIQALGLHYLCGVRVGAVRDERSLARSVFGFRYDTLMGHIEAGSEWFVLTKDHESGEIEFRISAAWRSGQFPNWWSRLGFAALARRYQRAWHRLSYLRLRRFLNSRDLPPLPAHSALVHEGRPMDLALPSVVEIGALATPGAISVEVQS